MKIQITSELKGAGSAVMLIDGVDVSHFVTKATIVFDAGSMPIIVFEMVPDEIEIDSEAIKQFREV